MTKPHRIRELINRLARLDAAASWDEALNPAQVAALRYLARANRFSRSPSHVADYLGTTRGTVSQTLKALERKGYVVEFRSEADKRSISFTLTEAGRAAAAQGGALDDALASLGCSGRNQLLAGLTDVLHALLAANDGRAFGMCKHCIHHRAGENGAFCALLSLSLLPAETTQICHEQVPA